MKNNQNITTPLYLDYDLIALSNTMCHSLEEGIDLASSMLNAPFIILNIFNHVIIHSEAISTNESIWNQIIENQFWDPSNLEMNTNIYSVPISTVGKLIFYSTNKPTERQTQLAAYIGWMISQFDQEKFYKSDFNASPQSAFFYYLLNNHFDNNSTQENSFVRHKFPNRMQILSLFYNTLSDSLLQTISKLCGHTDYILIHKQKYRLYLFPAFTKDQLEDLSVFLRKNHIYAGLSYPFSNYKDCKTHTQQAIAVLNEAAKMLWDEYLIKYEDLLTLDVLYHYSSNYSLSRFRHPIFVTLMEYDKENDSDFYKTLTAYIQNSGNTRKTAKQLSMHRNTVLYRVKQITDITGYNIQDPIERASLLYAMHVELYLQKHSS